MMYRLLAVDVDGTLLDGRHRLSEKNEAAIRKYQDRGGKAILFSGRGYEALKGLVEKLQLTGVAVTQNGSLILDHTGSEVLYSRMIPVDICQRILSYAQAYGYQPLIYQDSQVYSGLTGSYLDTFETCMGQRVIYTEDVKGCYRNIPLGKILILDEPDRVSAFRAWVTAEVGACVSAELAYDFSLEIGGSDKGAALRWVSGYYGIPREEIAAIGDGENDKNMLGFAGLSIAMGNAMEGLKGMADKVTRSNQESGVAYAIEQYIN